MSSADICDRNQELAATGARAEPGASGAESNDARHQLAATGSVASAASAAAETRQVSAVDQLVFELTNAVLYHRDRLTWFVTLHRGAMFANVFLGTGAVATLLQEQRWLTIAASLLLAFVSAASLAFDFAGSARKHEDRRRVYHDLAAQLEESVGDEAACRAIRAKLIRAAADDPHVYNAADALAFNAAIKSLGRDPADEFILTDCQRRLRHLRSYSSTRFPQRKDLPPDDPRLV
jgi:hypothetical protein